MQSYDVPEREYATRRLKQAADVAWGYLSATIYFRTRQGQSLVGHIPEVSLEEAERRVALGKEVLALIEGLDQGLLCRDDRLTAALLSYYADNWVKDVDRYWLAFDLSGVMFYGPFIQTAYTGGFAFNFISGHLTKYQFERNSDVDDYLELLSDVTRLLRQIHERTEEQAKKGIRIHRPQIAGVTTLLRGLRSVAELSYPVDTLRLGQIEDPERHSNAISDRISDELLPAFDALVEQLDDEYAEKAPNDVGIGMLPGGKSVYADLLKMHTTLDLSPDQVHQLGLDRLQRISQEKAEIREKLGFVGSAEEFERRLRQHPGAIATSADNVGEIMRAHKDRVEERFDEYFSERSPKDYDLQRLDESLEDSMTWGYYQAPTDAEPTGKYLYNGSKLDSQAVLGAASLVFHELVPGHHLHFTLQAENTDLHPVRRYAFVNAFNEAWAEYAANLAGEMGLYDDPYDHYGRCIMDSFLTTRLVVDTGMNYLGWGLSRAQDFMAEHTLCVESEINSECLRYACGIPAQSLAYKLGDEEILRVREGIQERQSDAFDYRKFHSAILNVGGLPLPALKSHLNDTFSVNTSQSSVER